MIPKTGAGKNVESIDARCRTLKLQHPELPKIDFCKCKGNCVERCVDAESRNEMFCGMLPLFWRGLQQLLPLVFNSETRSDAEPQPGPSKRRDGAGLI
ncbi:hypothetical protein EVAR_100996_1 [Eumeta japonica]|uniref:Uncharacterized protein n=1 Tax=Eumeta variegata TaxID=151549 RepID=A0A4C2AAD5_EUMVA|nr:hypothetical protein EVAR_100996_1 [Eumeta japonica]